MECVEVEQLMMADIDGELDGAGVAHLHAHLATCSGCRAAHASLAALGGAVRQQAGQYGAPPHLRARISGALPLAPPAKPARRWHWAWINFGAAAAFATMLAITTLPRLWPQSPDAQWEQDVVSSHLRSLMADHLTDVASSDQHTVKPWFAGKLTFSPPVHDLAAQGYPLVGGRLDYVGGRTVAALVYGHHQHVINLFVWPADASQAALSVTSRQGYQIASWRRGGFQYQAVTDMNGQDLAQFEHLLDEG